MSNFFPNGLYTSPLNDNEGGILSSLNAPEVEVPDLEVAGDPSGDGFFGDIGGLGDIASLAKIIGGISALNDEKKWRKRQEAREDRRVAREERRQKNFEDGFKKAYA